jgi:hypothetical protein
MEQGPYGPIWAHMGPTCPERAPEDELEHGPLMDPLGPRLVLAGYVWTMGHLWILWAHMGLLGRFYIPYMVCM